MYEGDTATLTATVFGRDTNGKYTVPLNDAAEVLVKVFGPNETTLPDLKLSEGDVESLGSGKYEAKIELSLGVGKYVAMVRVYSPANEISTTRTAFFANPLDEEG